MYRLPTKVQIGGATVRIKRVAQPTCTDGSPAIGTFEAERHIIEVKRDLPREKALHVLRHELRHAALYVGGTQAALERALAQETSVEDVEELIVDGLDAYDAALKNLGWLK